MPSHTTLLGVFPEQADLHSLLELCSDLGLEVLSLQRISPLPGEEESEPDDDPRRDDVPAVREV
ncbi:MULTISPECIES: hypothetical protein [unclassified Pseudonocardia]|uniref:hypothetical protein n=1 Tax=unclassified Pseudonocardia TaxID=2619320 RepID=UPI0011151EB0|nr:MULTISPECIES: hypothetical protein [unclassified Pseudonocardia]